MVAVASLFTACSEDGYWDKYNFKNDTYSFERASNSYSLKVSDQLTEQTIVAVRGTTKGNVDVPVIITSNSDIVTASENLVHFVDGSSTAEFKLLIDNAQIKGGTNYKVDVTFDVPEEQLSISGATIYTLSFFKEFNWVAAGKGIYNNTLLEMEMECAFEIAENYNGDGYYCRVYPFASYLENPEGCYIPFFLDEAGNAVSIPTGTYNMGIAVNSAKFEFYYDPEGNYGSYCKPFVNDGNVYYIYGVWNSGGNPAWIAADAFMWTEGWPGAAAE